MNVNKLNFKIDTKEKMHVITLEVSELAANMTEDFKNMVLPYLDQPVRNLVINFNHITSLDKAFGMEMVNVQQLFYEKGASMVFCNFPKEVENQLDEDELLEIMNYTPTESEAWDIVQMEEIERELL